MFGKRLQVSFTKLHDRRIPIPYFNRVQIFKSNIP